MAVSPSNSETSDTPFVEQLTSLSWTYWVANIMEMFERLAYYGLRTVLPIYMVLSIEEGGPQFDHIQKASIYAWWALVQSFVPVFSGGLADRFGYKITVAIAIAIKVVGYLVMAFAVELGAMTSGGASATVPGHAAVYAWFMAGSLFLALGTAVFKPGLQGTIATQITAKNDSLAWSVFYQLVNLGGFLGPILAGYMRILAWKWVFVSCAVIVCFNYVLLLTYREPETVKPESRPGFMGFVLDFYDEVVQSAGGILEPRLIGFLAVFSGFWAMFYQLFDLLPNFIDQWVDSSAVYAAVAVPVFAAFGGTPPAEWGGNVPQEMMINVNAGMIMLGAFVVGYITSFMRSMTAMIGGILVSAGGILLLGTMDGWAILGAIAMFSIGEMFASPTKMRYFGALAPPGKKGLYLGYINATVGIGWSLGSLVAGELYQTGGDIYVLARRHLVEALGEDAAVVEAMSQTEVLPALSAKLGVDADAARVVLWNAYSPQDVWTHFVIIGLVSMVGLLLFDLATRYAGDKEEPVLIVLTGVITGICYGAGVGALFAFAMVARRGIEVAMPDAYVEENPWAPGSVVVFGLVAVGMVYQAAVLLGITG